jgi:hypothetical protein
MKLRLGQEEIPPHLKRFFKPVGGLKQKNLMLVPQRFAIAMQERGWIVRSEIVWAKTSAMPESVRDRPTSAWEPIWMFSKSQRYFYDGDAVRQPHVAPERQGKPNTGWDYGENRRKIGEPSNSKHVLEYHPAGASLRNVWTLGPEPSSLEHYAGFVTAIPRRCILAGTSEKGACPACGAPWVRVVERGVSRYSEVMNGRSWRDVDDDAYERGIVPRRGEGGHTRLPGSKGAGDLTPKGGGTLGWAPSCSCPPASPIPQTVLDPFLGSGTTAMVADRLGRDAIGIELNAEYAEMARKRIEQDAGNLFGDPVSVEAPAQLDLFGEVAG